jgi:hypothetical protein
MTSDFSRGLTLTMQAIRRQLAAMPYDLYRLRLIHNQTRRPLSGQRLWTPAELLHPANVRFLRIRNRAGFEVYILPDNFDQNAGFIPLDLHGADPAVLHRMRDHGHHPCLLLQTSAGHLQAWVHVSASSLEPFLATAIPWQLALTAGIRPVPAGVIWADSPRRVHQSKTGRAHRSRRCSLGQDRAARAGLAPQARAAGGVCQNVSGLAVRRKIFSAIPGSRSQLCSPDRGGGP